jgi:hypothetical protein
MKINNNNISIKVKNTNIANIKFYRSDFKSKIISTTQPYRLESAFIIKEGNFFFLFCNSIYE